MFPQSILSLGNYAAGYIAFFAGILALWGALMLQYWKRKERFYGLKWGVLDFEEKELERPGTLYILLNNACWVGEIVL